jgi:membrane dipeptidase
MTDHHPRYQEALAFHLAHPTIDGHADSILDVLSKKRTLVDRSDEGHLDFPRARDGGLAATVQTAWPAPSFYPVATARVLAELEAIVDQVEAAGERVQLVTTAEGIRRCHADGKLGVLLNIEGAEALNGDLSVLRAFCRLGVRILQPVWNHRNAAADGAIEDGGGGLSGFGRELVAEMSRLGMALDLSHLNRAGFFDVLERSEAPVLFTHGNCRALHDHRRNLADDQIRALAEKGGVFGISFVNGFLTSGRADVARVADHLERVIQLVGPAHVAYGSDFDGTDVLPLGLESVADLPNLTAELLARGYAESDLAQILGGNYLRVFEQVFGA